MMRRYNLKVPNSVQNKLAMIRNYREYTTWQSLIIEALNYGASYMLKKIETEIKKSQAGEPGKPTVDQDQKTLPNSTMEKADFEEAIKKAVTEKMIEIARLKTYEE